MPAPFAKASIGTSAVQLTASSYPVTRGVLLVASPSNTGTVYVGDSTVTAASGMPLVAGQSIRIDAFQFSDASQVYLIASASGQEVRAWVDGTGLVSGGGGGGSGSLSGDTVEFDPGVAMNTISFVRANDLAGADGTAVSSWALTAGSTSAWTQATGANQPVIKTGIIGGQKVVRFDGTNDSLATTNGGQALNGVSWYVWAVLRDISLTNYQNFFAWGNASNGQRRSMFKFASSDGTPNAYAFVGQTADVKAATNTIAAATDYFLEMYYDKAQDKITLRINGTQVANADPGTLNSYASDVMLIGLGPNGTEFANMDLAEAGCCAYLPSATLLANMGGYVQRLYGITVAGAVGKASALAMFSATNALTPSVLLQTPAGDAAYTVAGKGLRIGGVDPILTGNGENGVQTSWTDPALLSVRGVFAASIPIGTAAGPIHLMQTAAQTNVLNIQCTHPQGYSAIAFSNYLGAALAAIGVASANNGPWGGPNGSYFLEAFQGFVGGIYGDLRILQSQIGSVKLRVRIRDDGGQIEEYDYRWTEPSVNGPSPGLTRLSGRPAVATANDAVFATNITTGSGYAGRVTAIDVSGSKTAEYRLENTTLTLVSGDASFSTVQGTSKINVYASGGQIVMENKSGGSLNLTARFN